MNDWSNLSNSEIRLRMTSMQNEYESIKLKINNLVSTMDTLDEEYNKAKKELEKRSKHE